MGGLPVSELNALELEFLRLNDYSLFVDINTLQIYGDKMLDQQVESLAIQPLDESFNKMAITAIDKHWTYNKQLKTTDKQQ